ncbi:microtubule-associated protein 6 isoform X2 [Gadus morhua]|uniref:microtubule-associated protein 6 isoform X2 n=1 Tax=Gadus morhua TaxID=8049 RepID=UPI0011B38F14|nr:microtubule-associated protein 6-like isoform X2 [Gadus morhua]
MAWPCISRVCCLARFWNQFDKSDLSVPLTIQNYSDIAEQEVRSVTKQVPTDRIHRSSSSLTPDHRGGPPLALIDDIGTTRESFRGRRELGYKPREDYHPPVVPFPTVTQYTQDFKPWPIPRKDNFPWISNGGNRSATVADSPVNSHPSHNAAGSQPAQGRRDEGGRGQKLAEPQNAASASTSSYRQEYREWSGAKPAKSTRRSQSSPYVGSQGQAGQLTPETSYQAAFSGESHRPTPSVPTTTTTTTSVPAAPPGSVMQPCTPTLTPLLQSGRTGSAAPPGLRQNQLSERNDLSTEDNLVRTKLSPNPSALSHSGSRVFNI